MEVFIDAEMDSLEPTLIHCIQCQDKKTKEWYTFEQEECYTKFPEFAKTVTKWMGHYILGYDIPHINRLTGTKIKASACLDTLILSRLGNPERLGGHSLRRWGDFLGFPKGGSPDDWTVYTPYMLGYCKRDVEVNIAVYNYLMSKEKQMFSPEAIRMEHSAFMNIKKMMENGVGFDERKAIELLTETTDKYQNLEKHIKTTFDMHPKFIKRVIPKYKKDDTLSTVGLKKLSPEQIDSVPALRPDDYDTDPDKYGHDIYDMIEFNLNSPKQIVTRLNEVGWKPIERTLGFFKSQKRFQRQEITRAKFKEVCEVSWKISEDNLATITPDAPPEYKLLSKWKMLYSRSSWVEKQCLAHATDGRIHGVCHPLGAVTNRMTHQNPNLANISRIVYTDDGVLMKGEAGRYGYECRDLFCAEGTDYVMLGSDADGLELRMLAHYMEDEVFTSAVIDGDSKNSTDVHSVNQRNAGLATRDLAKTFIYAFLYGAGDAKIGSIIGKSDVAGKKLKEKFLANTPHLGRLIKSVKLEAKKKSVEGLDRRRVRVRSSHAALNTLLQSAGAIVCKYWMNFVMLKVQKEKLDVKLVLNVHDELQFEVHKDHAEQLGQICKTAMVYTGEHLKLNVPLKASYDISSSWAGTH